MWDVGSGVRTITDTLVPARVTKWVAFSADGAELWAANAGRGLPFRLSTADGSALPDPAASSDDKTCRRMLLFRGGLGACLTYGGFTPLVLGAVVPLGGSGVWIDAGQTGPDVGVILDEDGQVALIGPDGIRPLLAAPGATHVDITADGSLVAIGFDDRIVLADGAGRQRREVRDAPSPGLDVALSADGRWLAASGLSGEVRIWRVADGALRAVLSGVHAERVATVVFGPDALLTVGWDGRAHRWGLGPLETDEAHEGAEARWSLTLDDVVDHGP